MYSKIGLWKEEEKLFFEYFDKGSKLLDVGCGGGRTTIPLAKKGYEVYAIDVTPSMVKIAKSNAKKHKVKPIIKVMNATKLYFKKDFFDNAIFSFNGIEHLTPEELTKALKEIHRVVKPDGFFIFTIHAFLYPGSKLKYWRRWIKTFFTFNFKKLFKIKQKAKHFGDVYWNDYGKEVYAHFAMPSFFIKKFKEAGFKEIKLMPVNKVMSNEKFSFIDNFKEDFIFFICENS